MPSSPIAVWAIAVSASFTLGELALFLAVVQLLTAWQPVQGVVAAAAGAGWGGAGIAA